jgi:rRNA biogenesis protein RRP5
VDKLTGSFAIGKVVKVRIISVDTETPRIVASIRQAESNFKPTITDISGVEIGNIVEGTVIDVHKDNAVLTLEPSQARALISLKNLANHRSASLAQLRTSLKEGTKLEGLIVVQRNPEKGIVIVANSPKAKPSLPSKSSISMDNVAIGQIVGGRVTRHSGIYALVKINAHIGGVLHPTNLSDDYDMTPALPAVDSVIRAVILAINKSKNQFVLSTRHSRMYPSNHKPVVDQEISDVTGLHVGQTLRGYIKSIVDHGLFVSLAPDIDARVQIKELFDDVRKLTLTGRSRC